MKTETAKKLVKCMVCFFCFAIVTIAFKTLYIIDSVTTTEPPLYGFVLLCGYFFGLLGLLLWYKDLSEKKTIERQLQKRRGVKNG